MAKPKVEHHIYDSDHDGPPLKVKTQKEVHDYVHDTFISDSPVHVETFHDGKSQGVKTYDPKVETAYAQRKKFAFKSLN